MQHNEQSSMDNGQRKVTVYSPLGQQWILVFELGHCVESRVKEMLGCSIEWRGVHVIVDDVTARIGFRPTHDQFLEALRDIRE